MSGRLGLFEFLAVCVETPVETTEITSEGTSLTHASSETYDDDPELGSMAIWADTTVETRADSSTT